MLRTINTPEYEWTCDVCKAVLSPQTPEYRLTRRADYRSLEGMRAEQTWDACGPACLVTLAARLQGEADNGQAKACETCGARQGTMDCMGCQEPTRIGWRSAKADGGEVGK